MPPLHAQPLTDEAFAPYGRIARRPDGAPLAETDAFRFWSDVAAFEIEGAAEIGICTVFRRSAARVDWMERHARTPELLIPIDAPFLLPVMADGRVDVFHVERGTAVVIGAGVWHSAALPVRGEEATYFVVFRRGTPHEDVEKRDVPPVEVAP